MATPIQGTEEDRHGLEQGTVIDGRYRLGRCIGRGGFARVFEAEHIGLGRSAAVKVLQPPAGHTEAAQFVERFLREARLVARLSHPNVVAVYDFGVHEPTGQPFLAMELLKGHDLEQELTRHGALAPQRAQRLFAGALDALRAAHGAGVVHKDLKPSNLFLADPGTGAERLVLLDFGIATALDGDSRITKAGAFTGTPAYVAPEYARHLQVSPAIDVYQIGLILSEALSGVPCVVGESSVQIIIAHCSGQVSIPDLVQSSPFGPLILKATALDPSARFHDGGDFGAALAALDTTTLGSLAVTRQPTLPGRDTVIEGPAPHELTFDSGTALAGFLRADAEAAVTRVDDRARALPRDHDKPAAPTEVVAPPSYGWAAALAVLAIVALVAMHLSRRPDAQAKPQDETPTVAEPTVQTPPVEAEPAVPAAEEPEPTIPLEQQPRFAIRSQPLGAAVFLGSKRLGRTPVVLRGDDVDGSSVRLRFELTGYETLEVDAVIEDGEAAQATLRPVDAPDTGQAGPPSDLDESDPTRMLKLLGVDRMQQDYRDQKLNPATPPGF